MRPKGQEELQRLLNQLLRYDLLVLEELRYVPFSKAGVGAELLFEVVSRDYER